MAMIPEKANALLEIFPKVKPIIGTIHCLPFPGAPRYKKKSIDQIITHAVEEAINFEKGGIDGIIVENAWDIPFARPENIGFETIATMSVVAHEVQKAVNIPMGIVINANADIASMAVATVTDAAFIRVNQWANAYIANAGFVQGDAAKVMRYRQLLGAENVKIFADVHVKHGGHAIVGDRAVDELARDVEFFDADVVIATGNRTGHATPIEEIQSIRSGTFLPVIIGSGLSVENAAELMNLADGAIIGSSLKKDGVWWERVDVHRVKALMEQVEKYR